MGGLVQNLTTWFEGIHPVLQALIRVLLVVLPILTLVPGLIWWERRLLSWMQDRIGPNRVGPKGLLQPIADGVKLFFKEDITPAAVDRVIYFIAPAVALFPAFTLAGTLPWGPFRDITPIADVNIGVLYLLAISSLGVYGVVLAGYGSDNKYSLLGGLRSSAQLISYELGMGMALAAMVLVTGSLKMTDMVSMQGGAIWGLDNVPFFRYIQNWNFLTPFGLIAGVVFLICMIAETNRAPFDLPEAENELIAGYHTEYSSMKFAVFFMGEYAAMFIFSGIFATVFLGGWNLLPIRWNAIADSSPALAGFAHFMVAVNDYGAPLWFLGKCSFGITVYIWIRATLPRLRYDQLMSLGWRSLLPLAVANFLVAGLWILMNALYGVGTAWIVALLALGILFLFYRSVLAIGRRSRKQLEHREITLVGPSRRGIELVDPAKTLAAEQAN